MDPRLARSLLAEALSLCVRRALSGHSGSFVRRDGPAGACRDSEQKLGVGFLHGSCRRVQIGRSVVGHRGSLVGTDRARALAEPFGGLGEQALPVGQHPLS